MPCISSYPCTGSLVPCTLARDNARFRNAGAPSRVDAVAAAVSRCTAPSASTADRARCRISSAPASRSPCSISTRSRSSSNGARACGCETRRCSTPRCCGCEILPAEGRERERERAGFKISQLGFLTYFALFNYFYNDLNPDRLACAS